MAIILNIETSTRICSVAVAEGDKILASRHQSDTQEHARILHPFIEEVIEEAGIKYQNLDAVAVSEGPGSYTGLRIGVSTAKGLCYARNLPLVSVSTLKAMALHAISEINKKNALYAPMIDARRMEVYLAVFDAFGTMKKKINAEIVDQDSLKEFYSLKRVYYFGDGAEKCQKVFDEKLNMKLHKGGLPSAEFMNVIAQEKFSGKQFVDLAYFEPFYLKDFIAAKPRVKGLNL
ncbi:MAG: tRNA (adenosine(37)-N6)-threonylcarbamoyltransferase complex dimerization subunit type 1 TsaB [Bacteroidales bacterium]|nr:tRNA (adenosine(37)-N6)-threonylcarbamoyltransferase complex dimerization subunit type 1 TsaB [Bacteroidales bacterium]